MFYDIAYYVCYTTIAIKVAYHYLSVSLAAPTAKEKREKFNNFKYTSMSVIQD